MAVSMMLTDTVIVGEVDKVGIYSGFRSLGCKLQVRRRLRLVDFQQRANAEPERL